MSYLKFDLLGKPTHLNPKKTLSDDKDFITDYHNEEEAAFSIQDTVIKTGVMSGRK